MSLGAIPQDNPAAGKIEGVFVTKVDPDSPAADAGIEPGDIILAANQKPVKAPQELVDLANANKGKPLLLHIRRGDDELFVVIQ